MSKKILITDKVHDLLIVGLGELGYQITYEPKMSYDKVRTCACDYDALIINSKVICDQQFLQTHAHLKFIGRLGSGLDIINLPFAKKLGIKIISSPEGNANAVGEHALGMLLMLLHKLYPAHHSLHQGAWIREAHRGEELKGKTVGIIGFGHTGPAFANKLRSMDVDILVFDKYRNDISGDYFTSVALSTLLERSDIVSIHLPLSQETRQLVDQEFLESLKRGAIIINTSRGAILDSKALLHQLEIGHVEGACLDVLENEKPDTWTEEEQQIYMQLIEHPKTIVTPHIAGWTHQSLSLIAEVLLDKISRV